MTLSTHLATTQPSWLSAIILYHSPSQPIIFILLFAASLEIIGALVDGSFLKLTPSFIVPSPSIFSTSVETYSE